MAIAGAHRRSLLAVACCLTLATFASVSANSATHSSADLFLYNGKIITVEQYQPRRQALAVVGNRIVAVGSDATIKPWIGRHTTVIERMRLGEPVPPPVKSEVSRN